MNNFYTMDKVFEGKTTFSSYKIVVDVCLKVVSIFFKRLKESKKTYLENVLINPKTSEVKVVEVDKINFYKNNVYVSPLMIMGKEDKKQEEFILFEYVFSLLVNNHPFEGHKYYDSPVLHLEKLKELYGESATFIFDPKDESNYISSYFPKTKLVLDRWAKLPIYVKDFFREAFSKDAIFNVEKRVDVSSLVNMLFRFRNDIITCFCGNEIIVNNYNEVICDKCNKSSIINRFIKFNNYKSPLIKGTRIYKGQLVEFNEEDFMSPVGLVVTKPNNPNVFGLKNVSGDNFVISKENEDKKEIMPQSVILVNENMLVEVYNKTFKII